MVSRRRTSRFPGLTTLITTSSPSRVRAAWVWAIEAEPSGSGSIHSNIVTTGRPRSFSMIWTRRSNGNAGSRSSRFLSSSVIFGGRMSSRSDRPGRA